MRGREAKLEIVFREPPIAIIEAIKHCEVIELNYGKNLKEYAEDENANGKEENSEQTEHEVTKSENSELAEQKVAKNENFKLAEQPKKKRGRPSTKKVETT